MASWIHRSQYKATEYSPNVRDVNFAPLVLGMTMDEVIHQLEVIDIFRCFNVKGYRLKDGDGVYKGIIDRILSSVDGYLENRIYPVDEVQVSTVI